ncbi:hypothetical protein DY000_02036137 [Brassica cretica]|uniref:Uncharacterized protein n=1 Tax=Brassica cretica TaxID=69181 RepID=A0ABQ7DW44_BRACR|nr:hypothetical protein DY000_02036137 [Brassica cretica]
MTNRKKKKQKPSGGSPSTSSRSESSETKSYPPTLEVDASTVACSSPMNESQLLGETNSLTGSPLRELQGRAAAVADESRNPNPQISATVEIVPEEAGPEATSTQTMPVVPSTVIAPPTVENLNAQSPQEAFIGSLYQTKCASTCRKSTYRKLVSNSWSLKNAKRAQCPSKSSSA